MYVHYKQISSILYNNNFEEPEVIHTCTYIKNRDFLSPKLIIYHYSLQILYLRYILKTLSQLPLIYKVSVHILLSKYKF